MTYSRGNVPFALPTADRNFYAAVIKSGVPILDQDLNIQQRIGADRFQNLLGVIVSSGWVVQGDFGGYGDNVLSITASEFITNGFSCTWDGCFTAANLITFASAGVSGRYDLLWVEMWLEEVDEDGTFYKYGNVDYYSTNPTNDIIDPAVGLAATNRIQIRYRTRITQGAQVVTDSGVFARGARSTPGTTRFLYDAADQVYYADTSDTSYSIVDGIVYALPICKVLRSAGVDAINSGCVTDLRSDTIWKGDLAPGSTSQDEFNEYLALFQDSIFSKITYDRFRDLDLVDQPNTSASVTSTYEVQGTIGQEFWSGGLLDSGFSDTFVKACQISANVDTPANVTWYVTNNGAGGVDWEEVALDEIHRFANIQLIVAGGTPGAFTLGEVVTGNITGYEALYQGYISNSYFLLYDGSGNAEFQVGETLTGADSGATTVVGVQTDRITATYKDIRVRAVFSGAAVISDYGFLYDVLDETAAASEDEDIGGVFTFGNGDTTPSVRTYRTFLTANTAGTVITNFDNAWSGKEITIVFGDANTDINDGANISLLGGINFTTGNGDDVIKLVYIGTMWYEVSRSVN